MPREWDPTEREEFEEERRARRADRCRCGGDMPGRCPGPAYCPMCREKDDEDDDEHDDDHGG